jgi:hypothetical protein
VFSQNFSQIVIRLAEFSFFSIHSTNNTETTVYDCINNFFYAFNDIKIKFGNSKISPGLFCGGGAYFWAYFCVAIWGAYFCGGLFFRGLISGIERYVVINIYIWLINVENMLWKSLC